MEQRECSILTILHALPLGKPKTLLQNKTGCVWRALLRYLFFIIIQQLRMFIQYVALKMTLVFMGKLSPRTVSMSEYVLCVLCKCATKGSETAKYGCSYPYIRTHSYLQYVLQFYNYSSHPFNPKYVARCILFMSHRVE